MGRRIETGCKAIFRCPECQNQNAVMLAVNADDEAIACAHCGHRAATMGALLGEAQRDLAARLTDGLARRRDRMARR